MCLGSTQTGTRACSCRGIESKASTVFLLEGAGVKGTIPCRGGERERYPSSYHVSSYHARLRTDGRTNRASCNTYECCHVHRPTRRNPGTPRSHGARQWLRLLLRSVAADKPSRYYFFECQLLMCCHDFMLLSLYSLLMTALLLFEVTVPPYSMLSLSL